MIKAPRTCHECPITQVSNPEDMIRTGYKLLDEAQRQFSLAIGANTSKDLEILNIINDLDDFNLKIARLRDEKLIKFETNTYQSGFDRILYELEGL